MNHLDELRSLGGDPTGPHLADEMLAVLATAEALGRDIDREYPAESAHLGTCSECLESFVRLTETTQDNLEEMSLMALQVSPLEVYAEMLYQAAAPAFSDPGRLRDAARKIVAALPAWFAAIPDAAGLTDGFLEHASELAGERLPSREIVSLAAQVRTNAAALAVFLEGMANRVWGSAVLARAESSAQIRGLRLQPAVSRSVPDLAEEPIGDSWTLVRTRLDAAERLDVDVRAQRLSPLACRLEVVVGLPGAGRSAGQSVEIRYLDTVVTATTDSGGTARFEPVPVSALPALSILIRR